MPFDIDIQAMSIPVPPTPLHLDKMQWGQPTAAINTYGPGPSTTMRHTYTSSTKSGLDLNFKSVYAIILLSVCESAFPKGKTWKPPGAMEKRWLNNGAMGVVFVSVVNACWFVCLTLIPAAIVVALQKQEIVIRRKSERKLFDLHSQIPFDEKCCTTWIHL